MRPLPQLTEVGILDDPFVEVFGNADGFGISLLQFLEEYLLRPFPPTPSGGWLRRLTMKLQNMKRIRLSD